ncbi:molybdopterin-dependent oxidoreductase, partial [Streptomyces sp. T-3]|nr:molybdopterin-dependent oxidoreductase [Streptomyces sp. T-3]
MTTTHPVVGSPVGRLEGLAKVTGAARYTADHDCDAYAWPVPATVAKGRITGFDSAEALALPGALAVLTHENAARLDPEDVPARLWLLQTPDVVHHGQYVALAVATSLEGARAMAAALRVTYEQLPHDVELRVDGPTVHAPATAFTGKPTDVLWGDADAAYEDAPVRIDATYRTPAMHQHPLEPHAAVAAWDGDRLTVHDSTQSSNGVATLLARLFGLAPEQVTVVAEHIGGGFGSKLASVQPVLAALAARHTARRVKLTLPRRELPAVVGHRSATIQHLRLAADRTGRLLSLSHESVAEASPVGAVLESPGLVSRLMYAHANSRTTHRAALLDVPAPGMMRGPGETPGMFALESAMDELAYAAGIDPVELRLRNEPETDPETGLPFSSRNLTACLREGARRFGWHGRDPRPGVRREG